MGVQRAASSLRPGVSVEIFWHARGSVKRQLGDGGLVCCVWRYTSSGVEPSPSPSDLTLPPVAVQGPKQ